MQDKKLSQFPWKNLLDWYYENGRHNLPWRDYDTKGMIVSYGIFNLESLIYRVWLSEILLQQTQASRVVGFFNRMIERFPTIESLADTDYETFFPYYQGLGYYSRARNILRTAKIIHEQYGGVFPRETRELIQLPGVGPYTAEAIRAFGYGIPTLSWDTNLEKTFARYYHGRRDERLSKEEKGWIQRDLESFVDQCGKTKNGETEGDKLLESESEQENRGAGASEFLSPSEPFGTFQSGKVHTKTIVRAINNALMDFAAMVDLGNPANINWSDYPIQSGQFYETRGSLEPQETKKSVTFPTPDATIIVTLHENHRVYFSNRTDRYEPFALPPALTRDTREYVKSYFREHYSLELSVRPPHRKWFSEDGKPHIAVNAQVQVGKHSFTKHLKK